MTVVAPVIVPNDLLPNPECQEWISQFLVWPLVIQNSRRNPLHSSSLDFVNTANNAIITNLLHQKLWELLLRNSVITQKKKISLLHAISTSLGMLYISNTTTHTQTAIAHIKTFSGAKNHLYHVISKAFNHSLSFIIKPILFQQQKLSIFQHFIQIITYNFITKYTVFSQFTWKPHRFTTKVDDTGIQNKHGNRLRNYLI